jgi:hypothetical protein
MKLLRNNTVSPIFVSTAGVSLPVGVDYMIPAQDYWLWASQDVIDSVTTLINNGNILVKDSISTLSASDGIAYLKHVTAQGTRFNSSSVLFTTTNAQAAIEESYRVLSPYTREVTGFAYGADEYAYQKSTMSFNDSNRTFSISPKSPLTSFIFFIDSQIYVRTTTDTVQITDTEGIWYIYYTPGPNLVASQTPWSFNGVAFVAILYWDSTNKKCILFEEERHGIVMDWRTHQYMHRTEGTKIDPSTLLIGNYTDTGDGSLNSHATFSISDGFIFDEDIIANIKNSATPTNPFEQVLSTVAKLPVFYKVDGASVWRRKDPTDYPFYENPPNTALYNLNNAGTWSLASVTNGWFFATWLVFTTDMNYPIATILGQRQDSNLIDAISNNTKIGLNTTGLPAQEKYFYLKLVWQTSTSYTNIPKTRLVHVAVPSEVNPSNDRYAVIASYNGNAGTGKYLEFFPGQGSDTNPFPIPEISFIRTVTLSATANSTGTVSFYKNFNFTTPIFSISLSNSIYNKVTTTINLSIDDRLSCKVTSGSINKPDIVLFIQTSV